MSDFSIQLKKRQSLYFWNIIVSQVEAQNDDLRNYPSDEPYFVSSIVQDCRAKIAKNINVTMDLIRANPGYDWDYYALMKNPNLELEFIDKDWCDWKLISKNIKDITNPNVKWNFKSLSKNPNLNEWMVEKYPEANWDWGHLSANPGISWEFIKSHPEYPWDWKGISYNANITFENIESFPFRKWDWYALSHHPNITWEIIKNNPGCPWDWKGVFCNPNITIENYLSEKNKNWGNIYYELIREFSSKPSLKIEFVLKHNDWDWVWEYISSNSAITMEIVKNHPELPWDFGEMSKNPNLTYDFIMANLDKDWNWDNICQNTFTYQNRLIEEEFSKEWMASQKIKKWWLKEVWNPRTKVGRKKILRDYRSLNEFLKET